MDSTPPVNEGLERAFREHDRQATLKNIQTGCVLGMVLMPAGWVLDRSVYPEFVEPFFKLRLLASALIGVFWAVVSSAVGRRFYREFGVVLAMIPAGSIALMIHQAGGAASPYYAGLNLVLLLVGFVVRWTFRESLIAVVLVVFMYIVACLDRGIGDLRSEFTNNMYFLVLTGVIVVTGDYFRSRQRVREFALQYEIEQSRRALELINARLRELDEAKSRFFANISHELRTPLTLLLAPLESIRARSAAELGPQTRDWLDTMHANGMRLLKLINDLLDLVRLESGQLQLRPESFGVVEFVRGLCSAVNKMAEDKHIRLVAEIDAQVASFWGDRDKLEKVFLNLLFNAIKFTPAGGTITFGVQPTGTGGLRFYVQDTGMGIPPEQLPHVFTRFWQADNSAQRKYQGVGIGLALVKELVEAHQGRVEVQSQVAVGTRFDVDLPALEQRPAPELVTAPEIKSAGAAVAGSVVAAAPKEEEWLSRLYRRAELFPAMTPVQASLPRQAGPISGGKPRLLVADDEPDMLRYLKSHLGEDFQVLEAVDGRQAIELAQQYEPDVIVCDMMMPEMDGLEVCRQLRQRHTTEHVPILLLTARADEETKIAALTAGASDFLTKPFSTVELRVRVQNLCASRRLQRALAWQNKKLAATLEQLKETETQLVQSEKLASLGRLSAGIIHEINNPLNYVRTALHELKRKQRHLPAVEQPDFEEVLRDTEEGVSRVVQIISDLRTFAHPNPVAMVELKVRELVESSLRFCANQWKDRVTVESTLPEELVIIGNRHKLVQVFVNLLQNSFDALAGKSFDEGQSPTLQILHRLRPGWTIISVRDNGPGMDPSTQGKVFDPFFTTKDVGKGIGLGLSICYQIMAEHGGRIEVTSEAGKFCEFALEFPEEPAP